MVSVSAKCPTISLQYLMPRPKAVRIEKFWVRCGLEKTSWKAEEDNILTVVCNVRPVLPKPGVVEIKPVLYIYARGYTGRGPVFIPGFGVAKVIKFNTFRYTFRPNVYFEVYRVKLHMPYVELPPESARVCYGEYCYFPAVMTVDVELTV